MTEMLGDSVRPEKQPAHCAVRMPRVGTEALLPAKDGQASARGQGEKGLQAVPGIKPTQTRRVEDALQRQRKALGQLFL